MRDPHLELDRVALATTWLVEGETTVRLLLHNESAGPLRDELMRRAAADASVAQAAARPGRSAVDVLLGRS